MAAKRGAPPAKRPVPRVHHPLEPRRGGAEVTAVGAVKRVTSQGVHARDVQTAAIRAGP